MNRRILTLSLAAAFLISGSAVVAAPPVLEVSPTYLEFIAYEGGPNPENQILSIWRGGGNGPLKWEVIEDCNWLQVDPTSGKSMGEVDDVNVIVDISGLAAGTYNCQLTVDAGTAVNSPQVVDVNLVISGPEIGISVTEFEFVGVEGGVNPADQILEINNIGGGTLNWTIGESCSWLSAEPNKGSSTGEPNDVALSVDISGLVRDVYHCNLTVSDPNAVNSPQMVGVTLTIGAEGIWVNPNIFDVNIIEGCTLTQNLTIGNDGVEDLDFMIRTKQVGSSGQSANATAGSSTTTGKGSVFSVPQGHDFTVAGNAAYKPGKLIVRFAGKTNGRQRSSAEKRQILSSLGGGVVKHNYKIVPGLSVVELPAGMTVEEALKTFNKANGILYAEPDYKVQIYSTIPDDTRFDELWGMHNTGQTGGVVDADIDAPEAWDIATGSNEVIVAVIDTGVDYTHPDLAANMWVNEAELNGTPGVDDDGNGYVDDIYGYDFCNNDGDPMDDSGWVYHGTHCSGTIGAVGDNTEGVAGVNWNVRIMALKFLDSGGSGWTSDAVKCVEYSTLMGANLSSNSWGGGGYSQALKDAIEAAGAAGMLFVAAAGNDSSDNDSNPHYPSSYDSESLIAVMSTDKYDNKSGFSNWGPVTVDLGAPGSDILSCKGGGGYQYLSGTSMATPHVAGACALLWSMNSAMSNDEVKDILLRTGDQIPALAGKCVSEGRLNLYQAILETKAPWIEVEPEEGTVGAGDTNEISVTFSAFEDGMEMKSGTYEAEIVIISNDACSPKIVPVTMTVSADDLQVAPKEGLDSSGTEGGPFEPNSVTYTLTNNNGTGPVNWTTWETEDWLDVEPNGGVLDPCESIEINVRISAEADLLDPNFYNETLTFQNTDSSSIKPRLVKLTVKPPDCFTELFDSGYDNLSYLGLTFSPDDTAAYYEACRERVSEFPTEPNGGTYLPLGNDDFAEVILSNDANILFYGTRYDRFYIGSNGYITFGGGDTEFETSLENHLSMPRISGLFADLNPAGEQCISYKQLDDRVVVTFEDVPLSGDETAKSNFQIEMFIVDGTIRITWPKVAITNAVAGLSKGKGVPVGFFESNLMGYLPCCPWGDFDRNYLVNFADYAVLAMHWLEEGCGIPYWCKNTDLDFSGITDITDVDIFSENWLTIDEWWLEPVSHWKFDEGEGDTAYDCVWFNHGIIHGAQWTTGKIGDYALDFDGVDDYVECGSGPAITGTGAFTVSAWVKVTELPASGLLAVVNQRSITSASGSYIIDVRSSGYVHFEVYNNGDYGFYFDSDVSVGDGFWHHIVGVRTSTTEGEIYVDGEPAGSGSGPAKSLNSVDVAIGRWNGGGCYFDGTIDDVRIYNRALSAGEIQQLYWEGNKASNPNPADGAVGVDPNTKLSWLPGKDALSHDVYLGTGFDDVNDANESSDEYMGNYDVNSYDPNGLELDTTYFWRIDEVNETSISKGNVWNFTTWSEFDPNLIGWWKFDEGSGTIAYDSIGDNDGTVYGAQWTTGQIDGALSFDGVGDYVEWETLLDNPPADGTISFWFKSNIASASTDKRLFTKTNDETGAYDIFDIYWDADAASGSRYLVVRKALDGSQISLISTTEITNDVWYYVTAVWGSDGFILYMNATLEDSDVDVNAWNSGTARDAILGAYNSGGSIVQSFNGTIDDVRIYDRALSAEEIQQLYQEGL